MPTDNVSGSNITKIEYGGEKSDAFTSVAFYADEVFKADGDVYKYATYDDPKERATIVGFDKRAIVLPIRGKGIGAIVSVNE